MSYQYFDPNEGCPPEMDWHQWQMIQRQQQEAAAKQAQADRAATGKSMVSKVLEAENLHNQALRAQMTANQLQNRAMGLADNAGNTLERSLELNTAAQIAQNNGDYESAAQLAQTAQLLHAQAVQNQAKIQQMLAQAQEEAAKHDQLEEQYRLAMLEADKMKDQYQQGRGR